MSPTPPPRSSAERAASSSRDTPAGTSSSVPPAIIRSASRSPSPPPREAHSPSHRSPSPPAGVTSHRRSPSPSPSPSPSRSRSLSSRSISPPPRRDASLSPATARKRDRLPSGPCVKVTGLTKMVTKAHVEEIFGYYGQIKDCSFPLYARSYEAKGNAWIAFSTTSSAEKAIEHMDRGQIDGAVVSVDFGRFAPPETQRRESRDEKYYLNSRDVDRNGRSSRDDGGRRNDRYQPSASRHHPRDSLDGPSFTRYPPPHLAREGRNGYARRSPSPTRRSRSPPPRKLKRHRSLSRSLSPDRPRGRRYNSRSPSPSRSRSRSFSPPRKRRESYNRDSRSPSSRSRGRSTSRSPSVASKRRGEIDRDVGGEREVKRASDRRRPSTSVSRSKSRSRSQSLDRKEGDARRDRMSLSPVNSEGRP